MKIVDLHTHSTKSDGTFTPTQLVEYALEKGLSAIALSDHDTTEGLHEAMEAAKGTDLEVIPAIEFSTEYEGRDIHILGLYIDPSGQEFAQYLQDFRDSRDLRNRKMCEKLTSCGVPVSYEELTARFPGAVITRAHYANYMLEKGYVKSHAEAFDRYIGDRAPCFLPREKVTPMQAVDLILRSGGVPVLAHPPLYHMSDARLEQLVSDLKEAGLAAIEALYSTYNTAQERQMRQLADKYDLLISGGSDFHGGTKPGLDLAVGYGSLCVPYDILDRIKQYRRANGRYRSKIIFSDIDGTLLDDEKKLSPAVYQKILDFTAQGGHFVLSSGRPLCNILHTMKQLSLNLPHTYIISYNGALVYDCDNKCAIWEKRIPFECMQRVLDIAASYGVHCHTYMTDFIVSPEDDKELAYYRSHIQLPAAISKEVALVMSEEPFKLLMIELEDPEKLETCRRAIDSWSKGFMHTFYSSPFYLECCMLDASKGNAVRFLCGHLGIDVADSIAVGDAANDIPMLEAAGCGICMCNGTEDAKKAADVITSADNNHDGFLEVFAQL